MLIDDTKRSYKKLAYATKVLHILSIKLATKFFTPMLTFFRFAVFYIASFGVK